MKKYLCLLLSVILAFSFLQLGTSAADSEEKLPFSCTVYSDKQSYEKGEEISVYVSLKNTSLDEITDMRIWMDYPLTDYYLTPGITEHFINSFRESVEKKMRVCEDEGVMNFASKFEGTNLIRKFLLKLAHAYKKLTLAYTTIQYGFENAFVSFRQKKTELGTVKVMYDNTEIEFTVKCRYSVNKSQANKLIKMSDEIGAESAEIKAVENSYTGLAFAISDNENSFGLFTINPDFKKAYIFSVENGVYNLLGTKTVNIEKDKFYQMEVFFSDNRAICYLYNNPNDSEPYPVFDLKYESAENGYGVFAQDGGYKDFKVLPRETETYEKTYTNPIYDNAPDPYILKEGQTYYLYATTGSTVGYRVSTSTDLVNWKSLGFCAKKGEIYGESKFWAPEVYKYNGKYYLLYSTDEHLALAVADSPAGPFVKTKDGYLFEDECIDGHLLFDDDGSIYLYMAYWAETGEEIWACKMKSDLSGIVRETLTQLTSCKDDEGGVNEGPAVLKYQGKYYLTYSVNGYTDQNYSVRLAVSDSPLGTFVSKGTILEKSVPIVGTGHHCFTTSPDGTELIIAYHCHYSTTRIHDRRLCIDRCKFVETDDGYTISVYGPTATPQPYPSDK